MKTLTKAAKKALAEIGRAGGRAKAAKMTDAQRKELGRKLAEARAAKKGK